MHRRLLASLASLIVMIGTAQVVMGSPARAATAGGHTLAALTVRSGPGDVNSSVGSLGSGVTVTLRCHVVGARVSGPYGAEDIWDELDSGGFVPDALIYTGSNTAVVGDCPSAQFGVGNYPVAWTGGGGTVARSGPSSSAPTVGGSLADGFIVSVACETTGDAVTDSSNFTSDLWDRLTGGGYVANVFLDTQVNGPTPGLSQCADASGGGGSGSNPAPNPGSAQPTPTHGGSTPNSTRTTTTRPISDPCIARYGAGAVQSTHSIFGGQETDYDRTASEYQVCEGYGVGGSTSAELSVEAKCTVLAVMVTIDSRTGAETKEKTQAVCDALGVAVPLAKADWAGAAKGAVCSFLEAVVPEAAGIVVAGAASETGPGAAAVGVNTFKALRVAIPILCSGLLQAIGSEFGSYLEAHHETQIAQQIADDDKCLRSRTVFGLIVWSAASC